MTVACDVRDADALLKHLEQLSQGVAQWLKKEGLAAGTIALKLRYADFTTLTRQMRLAAPTDDGQEIHRATVMLFERAWQRGRPVRLLGVAGRNLSSPAGQLPLF